MKNLIKASAVFLAVVALGSNAFSQSSTIGFANNPLVPVIDGTTGMPAGNTVTVGLYYSDNLSASADELILGGTTRIFASGVFNNGGVALQLPLAGGTSIVVEMRAWNNDHADFAAALGDGSALAGRSGLLPNVLTTAAVGSPPQNLVIQGGLSSFEITPVPEPSTIALGILGGLGAMLLFRRRK